MSDTGDAATNPAQESEAGHRLDELHAHLGVTMGHAMSLLLCFFVMMLNFGSLYSDELANLFGVPSGGNEIMPVRSTGQLVPWERMHIPAPLQVMAFDLGPISGVRRTSGAPKEQRGAANLLWVDSSLP